MTKPTAPNVFELWHQCRELLESVPAKQWETLSIAEKRRAGILAKWVIEKLLNILLIAQNRPGSNRDDIPTLYLNSGAKLLPDQEALLLSVVPKISTDETDDYRVERDYETTYWLAVTMNGYVHNCIAVTSIRMTP